jgi:hypothetical protein
MGSYELTGLHDVTIRRLAEDCVRGEMAKSKK